MSGWKFWLNFLSRKPTGIKSKNCYNDTLINSGDSEVMSLSENVCNAEESWMNVGPDSAPRKVRFWQWDLLHFKLSVIQPASLLYYPGHCARPSKRFRLWSCSFCPKLQARRAQLISPSDSETYLVTLISSPTVHKPLQSGLAGTAEAKSLSKDGAVSLALQSRKYQWW